jgi:hypothetical protein
MDWMDWVVSGAGDSQIGVLGWYTVSCWGTWGGACGEDLHWVPVSCFLLGEGDRNVPPPLAASEGAGSDCVEGEVVVWG